MVKSQLKKVLITGATGFVGSNLIRKLVKEKYQVHAIVRKSSNTKKIADILSKIILHEGDLKDNIKIKHIVLGIHPNIIFHLASETIYSSAKNYHDNELLVNFLGTVNLIAACRDINYDCFINTGSSSEYGIKQSSMKETNLCEPINMYGLMKYTSTKYSQIVANAEKKPIVTLRLFSPFGPLDNEGRLINRIFILARANRDLPLTQPDIVRDYVYIEDVVSAYRLCIAKSEKLSGKILNIGSGQQQTILSVVNKIVKLTNSKSRLKWNHLRTLSVEPKIWRADITLAKKLLGWKPKFTFDQGLKMTYDWFQNTKS